MKFLFTSSFYPPFHIGGDAMHVAYLATELARLGHEVHVMHSLDAYKIKRSRKPEAALRNDDVHTHIVETHFSSSAYSSYLLGSSHHVNRALSDLIREVKPDVVHHHNLSLLGYPLFRKHGNYLNLYTAHDYWLFCQQNSLMKFGRSECKDKSCFLCSLGIRRPRQLWRYFPGFREAIGELDFVIAPSNYMLQRMRNEFPSMRLVHIANFAPRIEASRQDEESSRPHDVNFVYVGVLEHHKGIIPLLEEYANWARTEGNLPFGLEIIGSGSLKNYVTHFIEDNGLSEHISNHGSLPTIQNHLVNSVALVLPSIWPENAPLVALEAISFRTPVVGTNMGGIPEIVNQIDPQLVFSWEQETGIRRALKFAFQNREALRPRARSAFDNNFSPEVYLRHYFNLITQLNEDAKATVIRA